jgi:hypothetical protein
MCDPSIGDEVDDPLSIAEADGLLVRRRHLRFPLHSSLD